MARSFSLALSVWVVLAGCFSKKEVPPTMPGEIFFNGSVDRGASYQFDMGYGFTFALEGKGPWNIRIFHESQKGKDLVYPVNPPYRAPVELMIGEGYGKTEADSIKDFPRDFRFIYRPQDILPAWDALEKVLWPKTPADAGEGTQFLGTLPTGKGTIELLSVEDYPVSPGSPTSGLIKTLKFKVHLTWGQ